MIKILFMIPDLSVGGAEKVLVNLVNNMDKDKYDITIQTVFAGGVNEQFLNENIKIKHCFKKKFRGSIQLFRMFSPKRLYKKFIKEHYDIAVSYLEGPTARIISGCPDESTKLVSWIHIEQHNQTIACKAFKSLEEGIECYSKFNKIICVSEYVKEDFSKIFGITKNLEVLYNTNETKQIVELSDEKITDVTFNKDEINICVVGKVVYSKGCDRMVRIQKKLRDGGLKTHIYFIGVGEQLEHTKEYAEEFGVGDSVSRTGYQTNPYKYVKQCDLFVCASVAEGFSTAATEALILGVPVVTYDVSGMREMLGNNNEYGIVTEKDENKLYEGIKQILTTPGMLEDYAQRAAERGKFFSTEKTVMAVEQMFENILNK